MNELRVLVLSPQVDVTEYQTCDVVPFIALENERMSQNKRTSDTARHGKCINIL